MAEERFFPGWGSRHAELQDYLAATYKARGFEVQTLSLPGKEKGAIIQVQEHYEEDWHKALSNFTGLDTAATVSFKVDGQGLFISVGGGKWLDKAAVAGMGAIMSAGLLFIPAGIGALKQSKLLQEILTHLETYIQVQSSSKEV